MERTLSPRSGRPEIAQQFTAGKGEATMTESVKRTTAITGIGSVDHIQFHACRADR